MTAQLSLTISLRLMQVNFIAIRSLRAGLLQTRVVIMKRTTTLILRLLRARWGSLVYCQQHRCCVPVATNACFLNFFGMTHVHQEPTTQIQTMHASHVQRVQCARNARIRMSFGTMDQCKAEAKFKTGFTLLASCIWRCQCQADTSQIQAMKTS